MSTLSDQISEAFDDDASPGVSRFWRGLRQSDHIYAKHPLMAMYGYESAQKSYQDNIEKLRQIYTEYANLNDKQFMQRVYSDVAQVYMSFSSLEAPHRRKLEELAKEIVSKTWGIDKNWLNAQLTRNITLTDSEPGNEPGDEEDMRQDDGQEDLTPQINKRITMNTMIQGAAVHNMMSLHHLIKDELDKIDPKLMRAYGKFGQGSLMSYWIIDYAAMLRQAGMSMQAGAVKVVFDDDTPTVKAQAMCFPVLVQELVKGAMECLMLHGLSELSPAQAKAVIDKADKFEDEPWLIQVGPHLWRAFLKIVPKNSNLALVVAKIAMTEPEFIHDILSKTIEAVHSGEDLSAIKSAIAEMVEDIEEELDLDLTSVDDDFGEDPEYGDSDDDPFEDLGL